MTREWVNIKPLLDKDQTPEWVQGRKVFSAWAPRDDIFGIEFWQDEEDNSFNVSVFFKEGIKPITLSFPTAAEAWKKWNIIQGALGIKGYEKRGPKKVVFENFNPDDYDGLEQLLPEGECE